MVVVFMALPWMEHKARRFHKDRERRRKTRGVSGSSQGRACGFGLSPHARMGAAFVTASADNLDLVGDSLAMSTAVFFLVRSGAATGRVCAFLGAGGRHIPLLEWREQR